MKSRLDRGEREESIHREDIINLLCSAILFLHTRSQVTIYFLHATHMNGVLNVYQPAIKAVVLCQCHQLLSKQLYCSLVPQ